jgi:predicted aldo/keto reductase-like oxidoreductase
LTWTGSASKIALDVAASLTTGVTSFIMQYRAFGSTGYQISALGFGAMRLPMREGHVDEEQAVAAIHRGFELGINYIDTALGYCAEESEIVVGKALKGWRDRVWVSTKNPLSDRPADQWRACLEKQLAKLDVDALDVYHCHGINWKVWEDHLSRPGMGIEAALKAKEEGLFRHFAFSFHDRPENLKRLADTGIFEIVTCQYNLLDRSNEEAMAYARQRGLGVVVMGPVGGGRLGGPSQALQGMVAGGASSTAEVALRFVLANPSVSCAISGMGSVAMVEENCATASRTEPLSEGELDNVRQVLDRNRRLAELYCTGCNYCMPCPHGVNIPGNFEAMNYHRVYGLTEFARSRYRRFGPKRENNLPASACQECGECEPKCPQKIPIIEQLKETDAALGGEA